MPPGGGLGSGLAAANLDALKCLGRIAELACGTPAVTTAANGAAEFITPGENGVILPQPDDIAGLGDALAAFLARGRDPEVHRAAEAAVAGLSWEATVAQTLEVLEEASS